MDNLMDSLGIKRIDRMPNAQAIELCKVMREMNENIDEHVLW